MDLSNALLIFAQPFSKSSREAEFPFRGDFGRLRRRGLHNWRLHGIRAHSMGKEKFIVR